MQNLETRAPVNPFVMMGDAEAVAEALKRAKSWNLKSRVCHPLDRPSRARLSKELAQFDAFVDSESSTDVSRAS
jgi:hypothetical protein